MENLQYQDMLMYFFVLSLHKYLFIVYFVRGIRQPMLMLFILDIEISSQILFAV